MKKYWYFVRYSCYDSNGWLSKVGMKQVVCNREISHLNDIKEITAQIKIDYGIPPHDDTCVLIDFYSLLRVEDVDSEQK